MAAAATPGSWWCGDCHPGVPIGVAARADLLRIFQLPENETRRLWRQKFDPAHRMCIEGGSPLQKGYLTAKEGIDMGADVLHGASVVCPR